MPSSLKCRLCRQWIVGRHSITRHLANLKRSANDPDRCDNIISSCSLPKKKRFKKNIEEQQQQQHFVPPLLPNIVTAQECTSQTDVPPCDHDPITEPDSVLYCDHDAIITEPEPLPPPNVLQIARRPPTWTTSKHLVSRRRDVDKTQEAEEEDLPYIDYVPIQHRWQDYVSKVQRSCSTKFWNFFYQCTRYRERQ